MKKETQALEEWEMIKSELESSSEESVDEASEKTTLETEMTTKTADMTAIYAAMGIGVIIFAIICFGLCMLVRRLDSHSHYYDQSLTPKNPIPAIPSQIELCTIKTEDSGHLSKSLTEYRQYISNKYDGGVPEQPSSVNL